MEMLATTATESAIWVNLLGVCAMSVSANPTRLGTTIT